MTLHKRWHGTVLCAGALSLACQAQPEAPTGPPERAPTKLLEFSGSFDAATQTLKIDAVGETGRGVFGPITVSRDNIPDVGAVGTVELVTEAIRLDAACGPFANVVCGDIRLRTFVANSPIFDAYAQITSITPPVGHEGQNSDPEFGALGNNLGLWHYGQLDPNGDGDTVSRRRTWVFGRGGGGNFTFRGTLFGDRDACVYSCTSALAQTVRACDAATPDHTDTTTYDACVGGADATYTSCRNAC